MSLKNKYITLDGTVPSALFYWNHHEDMIHGQTMPCAGVQNYNGFNALVDASGILQINDTGVFLITGKSSFNNPDTNTDIGFILTDGNGTATKPMITYIDGRHTSPHIQYSTIREYSNISDSWINVKAIYEGITDARPENFTISVQKISS